jgi:hypothetical protein
MNHMGFGMQPHFRISAFLMNWEIGILAFGVATSEGLIILFYFNLHPTSSCASAILTIRVVAACGYGRSLKIVLGIIYIGVFTVSGIALGLGFSNGDGREYSPSK